MRPRDHNDLFAAQKFIVQQLRQRAERNPLVENMLQLNIAARNCIADDHQIRRRVEVHDSKRLRNGNIE